MIITTASRTSPSLIEKTKRIAQQLASLYEPRVEQSLKQLQQKYEDDVLVVAKQRITIYPYSLTEPVFFHPNSAMFRVKRIVKGEADPFLQTTQLKEGMSLLDCTLGLASDSIVASTAVGDKGRIVGIETNRFLSFLVAEGLQQWRSGLDRMDRAMQTIEVRMGDHNEYLHSLASDCFDVVYFDPMFTETIVESTGIKGVKTMVGQQALTLEAIRAAKRVAKHRVVLKDHWKSSRFEDLGFRVLKRPTAKFHFGFIDV